MADKPFTVKGNQPEGWRLLVRGVDINRYHLKSSGEFIAYGEWLAAPRSPASFDGPNIMVRRTDDRIRAAYVTNNAICVNSCHVLKPYDEDLILYILAVLNAKLTQWIFEIQNPQMVGKVFAEIKLVYVENLPIKQVSEEVAEEFEIVVNQILDAKRTNPAADTSALEAEIDLRVYHLYGLTHAEVLLVDPAFSMSEDAYEQAL